eukprot:Skav202872  [mRNA]  locus=scaffold3541:107122:107610:+ [translate_table: standard]
MIQLGSPQRLLAIGRWCVPLHPDGVEGDRIGLEDPLHSASLPVPAREKTDFYSVGTPGTIYFHEKTPPVSFKHAVSVLKMLTRLSATLQNPEPAEEAQLKKPKTRELKQTLGTVRIRFSVLTRSSKIMRWYTPSPKRMCGRAYHLGPRASLAGVIPVLLEDG